MARISVHLPEDVHAWVIELARKTKRSHSQAASVIIQEAFEGDAPYIQGQTFESVINHITPTETPVTSQFLRNLGGKK